MKRIHLFILKSYLGPFIMTFFITTFVLLMQFLWRYIEDLVGKGLDMFVIGKLLFYISASLIPMALPLAILLASLMTFGNLGENYELTAIKSAGISLQRAMTPLIWLNILVSIGAFYFSNNAIPYANLKMRSLLYDIQRQKPAFQIKEGIFYNGIDGYSIRIKKKDKETGKLYGLMIYDHTDNNGNTKVTVADSGTMKMTTDETCLVITLLNGYNYLEMKEDPKRLEDRSFPFRHDRFQKQELILDLSGFGLHRTDENLFRSSYKMMNIKQLELYEDSLHIEMNELKNSAFSRIRNLDVAKTNMISQYSAVDSGKLTAGVALYNDIFFKSLPSNDRIMVVTQAIYQARRLKEAYAVMTIEYDRNYKNMARYQIEWHRKFTLSFACFIFFFIGAPMGAIIRKGGFGMPIVISVLFFILYYIITLTGEKFVKELYVQPWEGMWIPSLILLPAGVFLTYKATRDSTMFNMEAYMIFVRNFQRIFFKPKS